MKSPGEFLRQMLILELAFHIIWYCLHHAFDKLLCKYYVILVMSILLSSRWPITLYFRIGQILHLVGSHEYSIYWWTTDALSTFAFYVKPIFWFESLRLDYIWGKVWSSKLKIYEQRIKSLVSLNETIVVKTSRFEFCGEHGVVSLVPHSWSSCSTM